MPANQLDEREIYVFSLSSTSPCQNDPQMAVNVFYVQYSKEAHDVQGHTYWCVRIIQPVKNISDITMVG